VQPPLAATAATAATDLDDDDEQRPVRSASDDDEKDEQEVRPVDQVLREEDLREAEIGATHVEFPPGWGVGPSTVPKHPEREAANGASSSSSRPVTFFVSQL